jgi:hypothetical protein
VRNSAYGQENSLRGITLEAANTSEVKDARPCESTDQTLTGVMSND